MSEAVADVHSRLSCEHVASSFFGLIPRGGALQLPALSADRAQGALPSDRGLGKACSAAAPASSPGPQPSRQRLSLLASKFSTTLPTDLRLNESREQRSERNIYALSKFLYPSSALSQC